MRIGNILIIFCLLFLAVPGCHRQEQKPAVGLQVVTTLFPLYDFSRAIGGDKAQVTMLLPPGVEPHTFEPRPEDMIKISRAGLFVYTSPFMEPWADKVIRGIGNKSLRTIDTGQRVLYASNDYADEDHQETGKRGDHRGMDPHFWLDFANAAIMIDTILEGFIAADSVNAGVYRRNAELLKTRLAALDLRYRDALSSCDTNKLLHGGHYTFGYLSRRYQLDYHALSGISSDAEPSASRMVDLVKELRLSGAKYLFAEELLSPRLTETLAKEAGVSVLMLHGAHNLSRDEMARGVSFLDLMDRNLKQLQKGLSCSPK